VDSSDSESVSGGDDDDDEENRKMIEIPQHMVNAIKEAVQQEVQDLSSSSSILPTIGEEVATPMDVIPREGNDNENDSIIDEPATPKLRSNEEEREISSNVAVDLQKNKKTNDQRVPRSNKSKAPVTGGMLTSKSKPSLPTTRMDKVTSEEGTSLPPTTRRRRSLGDENNPSNNTELKRSESAEVKLTVPLQQKAISDEAIEAIAITMEPVVASSEEQQTREDKNLAALMTIRKLKEQKLRKSQSAVLETTISFNIFTDGEQERTNQISSTPKAEVEKVKETPLPEQINAVAFEAVDDGAAKSVKQFPQHVHNPSEVIQRGHEQNQIVSHSVVDEPLLSARKTDRENLDEEKDEERQEREFLPLFNESSGIFISNYEPEQLPGLSSWKLVCSPF
jgi:hypothetical protein